MRKIAATGESVFFLSDMTTDLRQAIRNTYNQTLFVTFKNEEAKSDIRNYVFRNNGEITESELESFLLAWDDYAWYHSYRAMENFMDTKKTSAILAGLGT